MTTEAMRTAFDLHAPHVRTRDMTNEQFRDLNQPRMSLLQDSWPHKVHAFRRFYQRPINATPGPLSEAEIQTHHRIIVEEWKEFWTGVSAGDIIETLDGGIDLIYTVLGALIASGIPPHIIDAAMEEVHASNMTKAAEDGTPILSPEGKILKGPKYVKADLPGAALMATPSFSLLPTQE